MFKAKEITALSLELKSGNQAVLLQEGEEWNGLTKFRCISPPAYCGQTVIATKDPESYSLAATMGAILGTAKAAEWTIITATPDLWLEASSQIPAATSAAVSR